MAEVPDLAREEAQAVVTECETIAYAPDAEATAPLDPSILERAQRVARGNT